MAVADDRALDVEGVAEQALGFGVLLLSLQRLREPGGRDRHAERVLAVALTLNGDRFPEQALGFGIVVELVLDEGEIADGRRYERVLVAIHLTLPGPSPFPA
jgi:hypothetical protein